MKRKGKKAKLFIEETCPICGCIYEQDKMYVHRNVKTKHHIFPKKWYGDGPKLYACSNCHTYGFHQMFPMGNRIWTEIQCIDYWFIFCKSKGKNAYKIYPELENIKQHIQKPL